MVSVYVKKGSAIENGKPSTYEPAKKRHALRQDQVSLYNARLRESLISILA